MKKLILVLLFIVVNGALYNAKAQYVPLVYDPWFENQHPKPVSPYGGTVDLWSGPTSYNQYYYPAEQVTRTDPEFGEVKTVTYAIQISDKTKKLHFAVASWGPQKTNYVRLYVYGYNTNEFITYDPDERGLGTWSYTLDNLKTFLYHVEVRYPANVDPAERCNFAVSLLD